MQRIMERKIDENGVEISVQRALEELSEIRSVEIKTKDKIYIARTEISGLKIEILRALSCKIPKTIINEFVNA